MMRNTTSSNYFAMLLTLSVVATDLCGCADPIVVGNHILAGGGDGQNPAGGAGANLGGSGNSMSKPAPAAPFTIGCNEDTHTLEPLADPGISSSRVVPDAYACRIAVDPIGLLVSACASSDPATVGVDAIAAGQREELFVQKRAADGSIAFSTPIAGLAPLDVATAANGEVFVLGARDPKSEQDPAFGLVKLTSAGDVAWNRTYYKLYGTPVAAGALTVAADGTLWVTGSTNFIAAQFDAQGNELQRLTLKDDGNPGWGSGQGIRILDNGDVVVAGIFERSVDFGGGAILSEPVIATGGFLVRYTASGQFVTSRSFAENSGVQAIGLEIGPDGSIVLTGNLNGTQSVFDCALPHSIMAPGFVAKLDGALDVQWATIVPAGLGAPAVDVHGNIVIATKTPDNVFLVNLDPSGKIGSIRSTVAGTAAGYRTAVAPDGTIYVSGSFLSSVSFGSSSLSSPDQGAAGFLLTITP